jgi:hypothetical protein
MKTFAEVCNSLIRGELQVVQKHKKRRFAGAWFAKNNYQQLYHTRRKSQGVSENILDNFLECAYLRPGEQTQWLVEEPEINWRALSISRLVVRRIREGRKGTVFSPVLIIACN